HLDLAWQRAGRHPGKVQHRLRDVFWLNLPTVGLCHVPVAEAGSYRARHDGADPHTVLPQVEHHCLCEAKQAELAGVVRSAASEEVGAGQTADGDDHAATLLQLLDGGRDAVEHTREVGIDDASPGLGVQLVDGTSGADAGVGHQQVDAAELSNGPFDSFALGWQVTDVELDDGRSAWTHLVEFLGRAPQLGFAAGVER